jgi:hypothetical protein
MIGPPTHPCATSPEWGAQCAGPRWRDGGVRHLRSAHPPPRSVARVGCPVGGPTVARRWGTPSQARPLTPAQRRPSGVPSGWAHGGATVGYAIAGPPTHPCAASPEWGAQWVGPRWCDGGVRHHRPAHSPLRSVARVGCPVGGPTVGQPAVGTPTDAPPQAIPRRHEWRRPGGVPNVLAH